MEDMPRNVAEDNMGCPHCPNEQPVQQLPQQMEQNHAHLQQQVRQQQEIPQVQQQEPQQVPQEPSHLWWDSDEDEEDESKPFCRICYGRDDGKENGYLFRPCECRGTMSMIHVECLEKWRRVSSKDDSVGKCDQCHFEYRYTTPTKLTAARVLTSRLVMNIISVLVLFLVVLLVGFIMSPAAPCPPKDSTTSKGLAETIAVVDSSLHGVNLQAEKNRVDHVEKNRVDHANTDTEASCLDLGSCPTTTSSSKDINHHEETISKYSEEQNIENEVRTYASVQKEGEQKESEQMGEHKNSMENDLYINAKKREILKEIFGDMSEAEMRQFKLWEAISDSDLGNTKATSDEKPTKYSRTSRKSRAGGSRRRGFVQADEQDLDEYGLKELYSGFLPYFDGPWFNWVYERIQGVWLTWLATGSIWVGSSSLFMFFIQIGLGFPHYFLRHMFDGLDMRGRGGGILMLAVVGIGLFVAFNWIFKMVQKLSKRAMKKSARMILDIDGNLPSEKKAATA